MSEALYSSLGSYTPDNLIAGTAVPIVLAGVTVASGQGELARGSVLGIITDGSKANLVVSTATDGSQTAKYILAEDIDATSADVIAQCYSSGEFNSAALVFGGTDTASDHADSLRQYGIYLKENIAD
jgi:hypothetical protein